MEWKVDGNAPSLTLDLTYNVAPEVAASEDPVDEERRAPIPARVDAARAAEPSVNPAAILIETSHRGGHQCRQAVVVWPRGLH